MSVIVPVFDAPDYLGDCLDSVLRQLPEDCECIVVDDGSGEAAVGALKRYADTHVASNLRVFYESHGGASCARNHGLDVARGEYVCFLDGDDLLHDGFLRKGLEYLETGADLVIFAIDRIENGAAVRWPLQSRVYGSAAQFADHYIVDRHLLVYSQCNKFYRKAIIDRNGFRFDRSLEFGEDRLFNFAFIPKCGRIVTSPLCMLDYIGRGEDSMSTRHLENFADRLLALHDVKMKTFLELSRTASERERRAFVQYGLSRVVEESVGRFAAHPEEVVESLPVVNRIVFGDFEDDGRSSVDILVVLGSRNCRYRVEKAFEVGRRNPKTVFVVSGGNPHPDGPNSEAEFMHGCLVGLGVPPERIVVEGRSANTFENLAFVLELLDWMRTEGRLRSAARIGIVSGAFHLLRVRELLEQIRPRRQDEFLLVPAYGPRSRRDSWFTHPSTVKFVLEEIRKRCGT